MATKIEKIKDMIGYYYDWESDSYNYLVKMIDLIEKGDRDINLEIQIKDKPNKTDEKYKKFQDKLKDWHNLVVKGLVNGLTKTYNDGRNDDIEWVRARLELWESFGRCVMDYQWGNNYKDYAEKELKEVAEEGYKI